MSHKYEHKPWMWGFRYVSKKDLKWLYCMKEVECDFCNHEDFCHREPGHEGKCSSEAPKQGLSR